jgi:AcrR family transcriptional regulator
MATGTTTQAVAGGEDRRRQLVERAAALFDELGYHQTSVGDLAEACGIRKPTLYHYFSGKEEILFSIHDQFIELLMASQREREEQGVDPVDSLRGVMGDVLALLESHPGYVRVFFEHRRELSDEGRATIQAKRAQYQASVEELFRRGVDEGAFRDIDPTLATLVLAGMCNWAYHWYDAGGKLTTDEIADLFWSILLLGFEDERVA